MAWKLEENCLKVLVDRVARPSVTSIAGISARSCTKFSHPWPHQLTVSPGSRIERPAVSAAPSAGSSHLASGAASSTAVSSPQLHAHDVEHFLDRLQVGQDADCGGAP